jgi:hypothetical protein
MKVTKIVNIMNKYRINLLLALILISSSAFSQGLLNQGAPRGAGWLSGNLPDNSRFSLEVGTGFSAFSSGTTMLGNYVSPRFEYDLNPSLTIIAGGTFSFNQYNNQQLPLALNNNTNNTRPVQQGLSNHSMFVSGRYTINDNLFLTGTMYREQGQLPYSLMSQELSGYNSQGMSMGIEYRISNSLRFGAEVGINRTNNPYHHYSPFSNTFTNRQGRPGYLSPF